MSNQEAKMSRGGWSCPHEVGGRCSKVGELSGETGMKGCTLYARYAFFDASKNGRRRPPQRRTLAERPAGEPVHGTE